MLRTTKYSLISILLLGYSFLNAQDLGTELQSVFDEENLMGMSVWVSANGVEQLFDFGLKDATRNLEVDENTLYRIASISKTFTAIGLLKLYDNSSFELDDDISDYLNYTVRNPNFPNTPITFRMLLSHTSSLQDGTGYNNFLNATYTNMPIPSISELLLPSGNYYTPNMWRSETPGSYFAYSNINFGLIGTLIEAISGERFDVYMKTEILQPLNIAGSFNIQDIQDINDVAAIYRNVNNQWQPQYDNYQGETPNPPNLNGYVPGTNGIYFAPQGGLRISAQETGNILKFLFGDTGFSLQFNENTLAEMQSIEWDYNGNNGDNYFGLFNRWGLGIQHANVTNGDQICNLGTLDTFLGHPGEAYGLISDAYYMKDTDFAFTFITNGSFNGYSAGNISSFYTLEESVFNVLCNYFTEILSIQEMSISSTIKVTPIPANKKITINQEKSTLLDFVILDINSKSLMESSNKNQNFDIDISALQKGIYFIVFDDGQSKQTQKIIVE